MCRNFCFPGAVSLGAGVAGQICAVEAPELLGGFLLAAASTGLHLDGISGFCMRNFKKADVWVCVDQPMCCIVGARSDIVQEKCGKRHSSPS